MAELPPAFSLAAGDGEPLRFAGADFLIKASAENTGGSFSILEEIDPLDTPLHVHKNEDELFFVLEGEHLFQVGDEHFPASPGDLVFAPRGTPHAQRRVKPRTGRVLVLMSPAGFENFFRELAAADREGTGREDAYARISKKYEITWL
jgi:mannose-6-phosphate isomerase-like protein (cupin superfamily)